MGRPRIKEKREHQLNIALTRADLALARRRAETHGMRLVDFARAMVCQAAVTVDSAAITPTAERLLLQQWKRVGNNLNQVARRLNTLGRVAPEDLETALADIRQLIRQADGYGS